LVRLVRDLFGFLRIVLKKPEKAGHVLTEASGEPFRQLVKGVSLGGLATFCASGRCRWLTAASARHPEADRRSEQHRPETAMHGARLTESHRR